MKTVAILYSQYTPVVDAIKYNLSDCPVSICENPEDLSLCDIVILANNNKQFEGNALRCHHSLLPPFQSEEPEKEAILSGAKVTGITIYYTKPVKIVAQYPVFITNDMHYDDLAQELRYVEQTLFPLIIRKIINNETFDVRSILNGGCHGKCGGCRECSH